MCHGGYKYSDMEQSHFLNSTCDIKENMGQRHATLPFLKQLKSTCDIGDPHQGSPTRPAPGRVSMDAARRRQGRRSSSRDSVHGNTVDDWIIMLAGNKFHLGVRLFAVSGVRPETAQLHGRPIM